MEVNANNPVDPPSHFYILIAFIAAFAGILFGYDTGVISGAILFISQEFNLSAQMNGVVVSMVLLGALVGASVSGRLADIFGRKRMLVLDALIFIIGTTLTSLATHISWLIVGRFIVGVAIGVSSYIAPLYISEISPTKHRGALVSLNQLAITVGILISYVVDYYASLHQSWRMMFAFGNIPAAILLIGMIFLPSSPRWMLSRGDEINALETLKKIRGFGHDVSDEFKQIKKALQYEKASWRQLTAKYYRSTLVIGAGLAIMQQITGINTLIYYAPTIFKMSGFENASSAILATMGVGAIFVLFTIIALFLIDTLGRRPLLFIGLALMSISLAALSWFFHDPDHQTLRWLALTAMLVFIAGFAISLGPIMWLMIAEVFPLKVRGLGSSIATACNWGSNWLVAITFLSLVEWVGLSNTFLLYFVISLFAMLFVYFLVPETKGISLEQIEMNLHAGKHFRQMGDV